MKLLKNCLAVLLCVALTSWTYGPAAAYASDGETATYSGSAGDNITWAFYSSTNTLVFSGSGAMEDYYNLDEISWKEYDFYESITVIIIGEGITSISYQAFEDCISLTSVTIPDSVAFIDEYAFCGCEKLASITIPDSVTSIGDYAFYYCKTLTSITIPDSVTSIGSCVFEACKGLLSATISGSVTSISNQAFEGCRSLTSVTLGSGVTTIDDYAFSYCTSLASIELPSSLTTIGYHAFRNTAITSVTIPASVTSMSGCAFPESTEITYAKTLSTSGTALSSTGYSGAISAGTIHENNYRTWSDVVNSYVFEGADGYIYRVEFLEGEDAYGDATGKGSLYIEKYTTGYSLVKSFEIPMELSLFGGFYAGSDGYYVVFGQNNLKENDEKEVIRVVKYSTGLVRVGAASLRAVNTIRPFNFGSLSITEDDEYLYVHTSRQMYTASDGKNHQANLSFSVNKETMICCLDSSDFYLTYVSHSFNQLIAVDDDTVVAVDHGDGYPRSVCMTTYPAGVLDYDNLDDGEASSVSLFDFSGDTGQNVTGASVGGLACSDSSYLVAFNSVDQSVDDWDLPRNIYLSVVDKDDLSYENVQVTSYGKNSNYSAATPQLVEISDDLFAVMWEHRKRKSSKENFTYTGKVKIAFFDGEGNKLGSTQTITAALSECQPVVINGKVTWSVSDDDVTFYSFKATKSGSSVTISGKKAVTVPTSIASATVTFKKSDCKYTGSAVKPVPTVTVGGTTLKKGTDYTVSSYSNNTKIGTATVKIKGKGAYCDSIKVTFDVIPPNASLKFTGTTGKTVTVAWKQATGGVDNYQLAYKKRSARKWTTVTLSSSTVSKTIKKLTKGKTYQVRVRAVKTVKGKTYAGPWSTVKLKVTGKKAQKLKVKAKKTVKVKRSQLKKAAKTVKVIRKVRGAKSTVRYKLLYASSKASKFSVGWQSGAVKVKKGTPKGTYTLKVLVSSSAKGKYGAACKVVKVKVKVR